MSTTLGLEQCRQSPPDLIHGKRFGLLLNQASVDHNFRYAHTLLQDRFPGQLSALRERGASGAQLATLKSQGAAEALLETLERA